jgi:hypothetical protein
MRGLEECYDPALAHGLGVTPGVVFTFILFGNYYIQV